MTSGSKKTVRLLNLLSGCLINRHRWGTMVAQFTNTKGIKSEVMLCEVCERVGIRYYSEWLETWYWGRTAMTRSEARQLLDKEKAPLLVDLDAPRSAQT